MKTAFENLTIKDYVMKSETLTKEISYDDYRNKKYAPNKGDYKIEDVFAYCKEVKESMDIFSLKKNLTSD